MNKNLSEDLLDAWLHLSMNLWNERLVSFMSYNESLVCHLLYKQMILHPEDPCLTLMQLSNETNILKSQMNKTINSLDEAGLITKERSKEDKRIVYITLNPMNIDRYEKGHAGILGIVNEVIDRIGEERSAQAVELFNIIAGEISDITAKGK